jgi:hypothetical protein
VTVEIIDVTAKEAIRLIGWRMDSGWYYGWDLMYNGVIDWAGHPGEKLTQGIQ